MTERDGGRLLLRLGEGVEVREAEVVRWRHATAHPTGAVWLLGLLLSQVAEVHEAAPGVQGLGRGRQWRRGRGLGGARLEVSEVSQGVAGACNVTEYKVATS